MSFYEFKEIIEKTIEITDKGEYSQFNDIGYESLDDLQKILYTLSKMSGSNYHIILFCNEYDIAYTYDIEVRRTDEDRNYVSVYVKEYSDGDYVFCNKVAV